METHHALLCGRRRGLIGRTGVGWVREKGLQIHQQGLEFSTGIELLERDKWQKNKITLVRLDSARHW